ncbi:phage terminase small subunit P27 family [Noviherbaspirillum cavernae]|uniref:Phage terminase small subunit P27 family n=1 Tax=Noviherbaspirillum cavernae TaxID=2320862 RepID=A0A418X1D3_9BURK|nr:phage terminase small subunit P27 family [Noviherbaspirillum cavernae]RJG06259.1 phage terminase small subunit P27 family [Noviherbaspirillum cavernae]
MGLRGPKSKPTELKVLEGNRGHRPMIADGQLRPMVETPDPPKHLGKEARKEWKRITVELVRYNIISRLDQQMLGMLCQAVERVALFETALQRRMLRILTENKERPSDQEQDPAQAYIARTSQGYEMQCIEYQLLNKEREILMKLLGEFGLSPAMRARVVLGQPGAKQLTLFEGGKADGDGKEKKDGPQSFAEF